MRIKKLSTRGYCLDMTPDSQDYTSQQRNVWSSVGRISFQMLHVGAKVLKGILAIEEVDVKSSKIVSKLQILSDKGDITFHVDQKASFVSPSIKKL